MDAQPGAEQHAPERLRRLPSWLVNRAALQATRAVGEQLARAGLRRHHYAVLVTLEERGPASQAELGRRLGIDRSDMAATTEALEGAGLVARARDASDRRRNVVRLTPAGARTLRQLHAGVEAAQDELLEPLSASERRELTRLLTRVVEHHGRSGG